MRLALYDPTFGYYARAASRSGRAGDFVTSVDVGLLFDELLEIQLAEMAAILAGHRPRGHRSPGFSVRDRLWAAGLDARLPPRFGEPTFSDLLAGLLADRVAEDVTRDDVVLALQAESWIAV
jgi:hypothetical protein